MRLSNTKTLLLSLAVTILLVNSVLSQTDRILTDKARLAVQNSSPDTPHKLWLFLSEDATATELIPLTEKARARRARVDPVYLLIDERDYPISQEAIEQIRSTGARIRRASRWLKAVSVEATADQVERLQNLSFVRSIDLVKVLVSPFPTKIEPIRKGKSPIKSTDFAYGRSLFQNQFINAVKLHEAGLTGKGVIMAILDTGFELKHPAFDSTSIVATYDFINGGFTVDEPECSVQSQTSHGTLILGTIGGNVADSLIGVATGADFVLAKTEITCGGTEIKLEEHNWIAAAEWADSIGADIITSSVGYVLFTDGGSYTEEDLDGSTALITIAADIAAAKNILVLNSAGNDRGGSWGHIVFPADGDSVLAVGAVTGDSSLASFSSPGPTYDGRIKPDIVSLGVGVVSARHTGGYTLASGTSLSTPLVAGGAALALEHDPTMTAAELRDLIHQNGDRSSHPDNDYGYGLFDATRSANIIKLDPIGPIQVDVDHFLTVPVTTSGRSDSIPALSALGLPPAVSLIDHHDGTGSLEVFGSCENPTLVQFGLVADVGYFADTAHFILETYPSSHRLIFAGPNPFTDSVRVFVSPSAGRVISVSVFNSAGERVWQNVNNLGGSADVITIWDGRNLAGQIAAPGMYLVYVETDRRTEVLKLLKRE
jgi:hypothetical protein